MNKSCCKIYILGKKQIFHALLRTVKSHAIVISKPLMENNDLNLLTIMELAGLDVKWADEILTKNQADRDNLEGGRIEDVH